MQFLFFTLYKLTNTLCLKNKNVLFKMVSHIKLNMIHCVDIDVTVVTLKIFPKNYKGTVKIIGTTPYLTDILKLF